MEASILERISVRQFLSTLSADEIFCVLALYLGAQQKVIADAFGVSPSTLNRMVTNIRQKFTDWNCN